ncbi:tRNA pseudouridine(38-40) synthase TruA [Halobacillus rhizosphaerae]|uniref:tRNA pseudouridine(38-40) synthase TruA n=1 Tax=Halobacillus rhizosphaerae TaxID=3064889 RepID=UPI00398B290E
MKRVRFKIEYDGTKFSGYQIQHNGRTVQEELEKALSKLHKGKPIKISASGRTDAGVHAKGQVIHFDTPLELAEFNWKSALSSLLPDDIQIAAVDEVDADFHSRYDAREKEYRYYVWNAQDPDFFRRHYTCHIRRALNIEAMRDACTLIEGEHDFTSFCSAKTNIKGSKVRTITEARIAASGSELVFIFKGTGFLYNMVRILVGTILEVGLEERSIDDIPRIIQKRDREAAGKTAPSRGLFLWKVDY